MVALQGNGISNACTTTIPHRTRAGALPAAAQGITLQVGASPSDAFAEPLYFAPSGVAAQAGIALNVSLFSSSTATAAGCASGALDIGVGVRAKCSACQACWAGR
jgi:ABC-type nitrate/sulfonate/bicarbonate transport system substrate-binding protein